MNLPRYTETFDYVGKKLWSVEDAAHPVRRAITIDANCTFPLQRGTVMAKVTGTGKFMPYDDTKSDGREVAIGLLDENIDELRVNATNQDVLGTLGIHGVAIESSCVGLDANAKVDLKGSIIFV